MKDTAEDPLTAAMTGLDRAQRLAFITARFLDYLGFLRSELDRDFGQPLEVQCAGSGLNLYVTVTLDLSPRPARFPFEAPPAPTVGEAIGSPDLPPGTAPTSGATDGGPIARALKIGDQMGRDIAATIETARRLKQALDMPVDNPQPPAGSPDLSGLLVPQDMAEGPAATIEACHSRPQPAPVASDAEPPPDRSGLPWTPEEDARILSRKTDGLTWRELAARLGRSPDSTKSRYYLVLKDAPAPAMAPPAPPAQEVTAPAVVNAAPPADGNGPRPATGDVRAPVAVHLDDIPHGRGWTPARDHRLMQMAVELQYNPDEAAAELDIDAREVKARFDTLTQFRRYTRAEVWAELQARGEPA